MLVKRPRRTATCRSYRNPAQARWPWVQLPTHRRWRRPRRGDQGSRDMGRTVGRRHLRTIRSRLRAVGLVPALG